MSFSRDKIKLLVIPTETSHIAFHELRTRVKSAIWREKFFVCCFVVFSPPILFPTVSKGYKEWLLRFGDSLSSKLGRLFKLLQSGHSACRVVLHASPTSGVGGVWWRYHVLTLSPLHLLTYHVGHDVRCCQAAAPIVATQSDSLRIFFRARFRARACFTLRLSPGFR